MNEIRNRNSDSNIDSHINSDDIGDDDRGDKFVTLAMDATSGATEAFQLSDVTVQMVHEGMFESVLALLENDDTNHHQMAAITKNSNPPMVPMRHPILVDGQETKVLDSVLCLVNTGVLSHVGSYSGRSGNNAVKKTNGSLTNKTKKILAKALESSEVDDFLKEICDFNVLLALDELLRSSGGSGAKKTANNPNTKKTTSTTTNASSSGISSSSPDDMEVLCGLVKKWARGQKKGTTIDPKFKMKLKTYLS